MATSNPHNIVILGGSYGGIGVAHKLLKALPSLEKETGKKFKVTMISNSTHFWFSVGAPRAMLKPYPKDIMDSFIPVSKGFSQYPSSAFDFVFAEIVSLDAPKEEVLYKVKSRQDETEQVASETSTMHYDTLVLATGSKGPHPLYSYHGSHIPTLNAYRDVQRRLPAAKSIMVVGGGTAGTETAGELAHLHGKSTKSPKDITILSGKERLLTGLRPSIGAKAEVFLTKAGVKVIHNVKLDSQTVLPDGKTQVKLSNGETKEVDLLIVATGRRPASEWLPSSIPLTKSGQVECDGYMRVASQKSTWVTGDLASISNGGLIYLQTMTTCLAGNILAELKGKGPEAMKVHQPMTTKEMQVVPVGPERGVGAAFGWQMPSFAVVMLKGKNFFFPNALKTVMGTA